MSKEWTNTCKSTDPPLTLDELHKLVQEFKQKRIPSRIEAGERMGAFIQDAFTAKGLVFPTTLCTIPVIINEDLPTEVAHIRDQEDRLMSTFILADGEEGPRILCLNHPPLEFHLDYIRPTLQEPIGRPWLPCVVGPFSAFPSHRFHGQIGPPTLRLEPEGPGAEDGGEPREDQEGGDGN